MRQSIPTTLLTILLAAGATATALAARPQVNPKTMRPEGPLRFSPYRPVETGLLTIPASLKPSRVPMRVSTAGRPELIANCILKSPGYGIYSFRAETDTQFDRLAETPSLNGSAVYVDGKYYGCDYEYDESYNLNFVRWYVYDAQTWHLDKMVENPLDYSYVATDRTYDPTTATVYSITYDSTADHIQLSTTDLSDGSSTRVGDLEKEVIMLACNASGQLYGIDTEANLYRVNKANASLSLVGNTGIMDNYYSTYTQSIEFDKKTGKLYWAEFHTERMFTSRAALYEVDPATASTVKVCDIPGNPELLGLYINDYVTPGVPDAPTALTAVPEAEGSQTFSFTFNAPEKTTDGQPLSGDLDIVLTVDNEELFTATAAPGAKLTTPKFPLERGLRLVKAYASSAKGDGQAAATIFYSGYDVPAAPANLKLVASGNTATLTWTAPEESLEGGPVRTPFSYDVTRLPDNVVVASGIPETTFSETVADPARYSYKVTARSADGEGGSAISNSLIIGSFDTPYYCGFDTQADFDTYTVVDLLSHGKTWDYDEDNQRLRHPWAIEGEIDDYILTPGIRMSGDKSYQVSFDGYQMVEGYDEHIMLYFGPDTNLDNMTLLLDTERLPQDPKTFTATVVPGRDGTFYFALRSKTGAGGFMSYADDFSVVEQGTVNLPAAVGNLTATAAAGGIGDITIAFNAPTKTVGGAPLESISKIEVMRNMGSQPVHTFDNPDPGEALEWKDSGLRNGNYTYKVTVFNSEGASVTASASAYAGIDEPTEPTDVRLDGEEGNRVISWKAPEKGVNGGNLEGLLKYRILRYVNGNYEFVTDEATGTSYTDTWESAERGMLYYTVTALTDAGESAEVSSNSVIIGDLYAIPFEESFAGGQATCNPWTMEFVIGEDGGWKIAKSGEDPYISAQDADGGVASFDGYHTWARGTEARLISPSIDISTFEDPTLTFYIYHYNGYDQWSGVQSDVNETMVVEVSREGGKFVTVPDSEVKLYAETSGWKQHTVRLDDYARSKSVRVAFRGRSTGCYNIHLDNIAIHGTKEASGISGNLAASPRVVSGKGFVSFSGLSSPVSIYDAAGRLCASSGNAAGRISIPAGVYIVKSGSHVFKILVK